MRLCIDTRGGRTLGQQVAQPFECRLVGVVGQPQIDQSRDRDGILWVVGTQPGFEQLLDPFLRHDLEFFDSVVLRQNGGGLLRLSVALARIGFDDLNCCAACQIAPCPIG